MNQKNSKIRSALKSKIRSKKYILISFILLILLTNFSIILPDQNCQANKSQNTSQITSMKTVFDIDCIESHFSDFLQIPPLENVKMKLNFSTQYNSTAKPFLTIKRLINQSKDFLTLEVFLLKYRFLSVKKSLEELQAKKIEGIKPSLSQDNLSFARGLVLGEKTPGAGYVPDFENAGMTHVLVASGFNAALIAGLAWFFVKPLPRALQSPLVLLALWGYTAYLDFQPPIWRAAWMLTLVTLLQRTGIRTKKTRVLVFSVVFILLFQPDLLGSLSLWLSVLATLGIIIFSRRLSLFWSGESGSSSGNTSAPLSPGGIRTLLLEEATTSFSAQALIFPLLVWFFESVNLVSFAANPVMLPWLGALTQLSVLEVILAFFDRFWPARVLGAVVGRALSTAFELYFVAVGWWQNLAFLNFQPSRVQTEKIIWLWSGFILAVWLSARRKHRRKAHFLHEKA